jgi:hypothetical protein
LRRGKVEIEPRTFGYQAKRVDQLPERTDIWGGRNREGEGNLKKELLSEQRTREA